MVTRKSVCLTREINLLALNCWLKESKMVRSDELFLFLFIVVFKTSDGIKTSNRRVWHQQTNPFRKGITKQTFFKIFTQSFPVQCRKNIQNKKQDGVHGTTMYEVQHRFQQEHRDKIESPSCTYLYTGCSDNEIKVSGELATTWSLRASQKKRNKL